ESGGDLRAAAVQVYVVGQPGRRVQVGPPSGGRVVVHHPEVVAAGAGRIYRDGEFVAAVAVEVTGHREPGGDLRAAAVQVYVVGQPGRRVQVGPPSGGRVVVHHPEVVAPGAGRIYRDGEFVAAVAVEVTGHREPGGDLRAAAVQVRVVGQPGVRVEMRPTGGRQLQRQPWIAGTERELCRRQRPLLRGA